MPNLETYHGYPLWQYIPSLPAASIFAILFGGLTILHIYTLYKKRQWFCLPFVVGGLFETIGYIGRALAYNATGEIGPYVMQSILLLLAPILFAASLYMTLGRTITAVKGERYSFIPARWLTRTFVFGDCFSFLIQASGAGLIVRAGSSQAGDKSPDLGQNLIVGGLILQIIMFGIFGVLVSTFHVRFGKHQPRDVSAIPWKQTIYMLYLTSAGIIVRNIFRVIQYATGTTGYALTNEWCTYVFDGVLMLSVMAIFWWYYPSSVMRRDDEDKSFALASDPNSHNQA